MKNSIGHSKVNGLKTMNRYSIASDIPNAMFFFVCRIFDNSSEKQFWTGTKFNN